MAEKKRLRLSDLQNRDRDDTGVRCTRCGCRHFWVVYTRDKPGNKIARRRECRNCGHRITTFERQ